MKRLYLGLLSGLILLGMILAVACTPSNAVYVHDTPPINVAFSTPVPAKIINSSGAAQGVSMSSNGELQVHATTLVETIGTHGVYEGHNAYSLLIMGRRSTFANTTGLNDIKSFDSSVALIPIMDGTENLEIVSSSINDTLLGTGAQKVRVVYLDTSNNLTQSSDISLNGTTPVALAWHSNEIEWMEVSQVGSGSVSAGDIVLRQVTTNVGFEQINAGGNKSLSGRFRVPKGYTAFISKWDAGCVVGVGGATQSVDFRLRATVYSLDRSVSVPYHFQDAMFSVSTSGMMEMSIPFLRVPELGEIKMSGISSALSNRADASFTVSLIAN